MLASGVLLGGTVVLASCTVSVASLTTRPSQGEYLSLIQELMAESAQTKRDLRRQRADRAIEAVAVWQGAAETSGATGR